MRSNPNVLCDASIPEDSLLALYVSTRLLCELRTALQLKGLQTRYQPPGVEYPQLFVWHPVGRWLDKAIYAVPEESDGSNSTWWFEWATGERICLATDMSHAARLIDEELREES